MVFIIFLLLQCLMYIFIFKISLEIAFKIVYIICLHKALQNTLLLRLNLFYSFYSTLNSYYLACVKNQMLCSQKLEFKVINHLAKKNRKLVSSKCEILSTNQIVSGWSQCWLSVMYRTKPPQWWSKLNYVFKGATWKMLPMTLFLRLLIIHK